MTSHMRLLLALVLFSVNGIFAGKFVITNNTGETLAAKLNVVGMVDENKIVPPATRDKYGTLVSPGEQVISVVANVRSVEIRSRFGTQVLPIANQAAGHTIQVTYKKGGSVFESLTMLSNCEGSAGGINADTLKTIADSVQANADEGIIAKLNA